MTRAILALALAAVGTASAADPPVQPKLPPPNVTPSAVKFPTVVGWPAGKTPVAPPGFVVTLFADGFDSPLCRCYAQRSKYDGKHRW